MITGVAFAVIVAAAWLVGRANDKDRSTYDRQSLEDANNSLLLHIRTGHQVPVLSGRRYHRHARRRLRGHRAATEIGPHMRERVNRLNGWR